MSAPNKNRLRLCEYSRRAASAVVHAAAKAAIFAAVALALYVLVGKPVRARGERAMLYVGEQLMRYADASSQDAPRTVHMNGTTLRLSAGVADRPLEEVMSFFADRCRPGGDLTDDLAALASGQQPSTEYDGSGDDGTLPFGGAMRGGDRNHAFVACLDGERHTPEGLVERAKAFLSTGDVGALGTMRYVYGERRSDRTHFIAFWREGGLRIKELFPSEGDAPGEDAEYAPRPPGSRRVLSMREEGHPYSTAIYVGSTLGVAELGSFYREALRTEGWEIVDRRRQRKEPREKAVVVAMRGGLVTIVVAGDGAKGLTTTIMTSTPEELTRVR